MLVDGLQAEREQGITIDVAYRYFETDKRKFIAADTPGHEQYTRNMATGASTAELAIILVDARKGMQTQTRRHSYICALLGIRHVVLAVNKMDLVDYELSMYNKISEEYHDFAAELGITDVHCVPVSALTGENVFNSEGLMPWYPGKTLIDLLETIDVQRDDASQPFRMPVQWVNRPDLDFRGFSGTIAAGTIACGQRVVAGLSGRSSALRRIVAPSGDVECAVAGQSVTLVLEDEIDISRGDLLALEGEAPEVADQFAAHIVWMDSDPMLPERSYDIRFACVRAGGQITDLTYSIDVNSLEHMAAKTLQLNEIGYCKVALDRAVPFDAYKDNRQSGVPLC